MSRGKRLRSMLHMAVTVTLRDTHLYCHSTPPTPHPHPQTLLFSNRKFTIQINRSGLLFSSWGLNPCGRFLSFGDYGGGDKEPRAAHVAFPVELGGSSRQRRALELAADERTPAVRIFLCADCDRRVPKIRSFSPQRGPARPNKSVLMVRVFRLGSLLWRIFGVFVSGVQKFHCWAQKGPARGICFHCLPAENWRQFPLCSYLRL